MPLCITCFNAFTCLDLLDDILILLLSRVTTEKLSGLWRLIWKEQKHVEWQLTVVNCWCQKTYSNQILSFQIKFLIWITLEGNNAVSITQQFIMYHSKYQPIISCPFSPYCSSCWRDSPICWLVVFAFDSVNLSTPLLFP